MATHTEWVLRQLAGRTCYVRAVLRARRIAGALIETSGSALSGATDYDVLAATQVILAADTCRDLLDFLSRVQESFNIVLERLTTLVARGIALD